MNRWTCGAKSACCESSRASPARVSGIRGVDVLGQLCRSCRTHPPLSSISGCRLRVRSDGASTGDGTVRAISGIHRGVARARQPPDTLHFVDHAVPARGAWSTKCAMHLVRAEFVDHAWVTGTAWSTKCGIGGVGDAKGPGHRSGTGPMRSLFRQSGLLLGVAHVRVDEVTGCGILALENGSK
jgi:hypothetical protein